MNNFFRNFKRFNEATSQEVDSQESTSRLEVIGFLLWSSGCLYEMTAYVSNVSPGRTNVTLECYAECVVECVFITLYENRALFRTEIISSDSDLARAMIKAWWSYNCK